MTEVVEKKEEVVKFEFDEDFQSKLTTHALKDTDFMRQVGHLLKPDYFENTGEAHLVAIAAEFFGKYDTVPDSATLMNLLKEKKTSGVIRPETMPAVVAAYKRARDNVVTGGAYAAEKVAEFARHQAVAKAILDSIPMLDKKQFAQIEEKVTKATQVGINIEAQEYDYFANIKLRSDVRHDKAMGKLPPTGISTGSLQLDKLLYHGGWGRRELTVLMGGAKAGKTTALINFAQAAALAGLKVLYVTLEVSKEIISERLDACVSDTAITDLLKHIKEVEARIEAAGAKAGLLNIVEYPTGSLTPKMLRHLIEKNKANGIKYDMIVVDYGDIMAPDHRTNDPIENSKSIFVGLRAIAFEEDAAVLTATQTNREGFKSVVAKAEHVSEDFNKIRIADLVISINITDEERDNNEARLYFAASRNQAGGFTVRIKQDLAKMKFLQAVLGVE
ncbi:DnaB-like helicase C-terminal domain-containing protein [Paraburkholderia nemoris]|uniref:DnaB-like helicase C-terminal domain-containing protein n=1 Tax=Paraburkholderia nemoris TaxID=2793076 RepID=UPI0038BD7C86